MDNELVRYIREHFKNNPEAGENLLRFVWGICGACGSLKRNAADYLCDECRAANDLADSL